MQALKSHVVNTSYRLLPFSVAEVLCPTFASRISSTFIRRLSNKEASLHCGIKDEPLRILYCGSDAFSCASLIALHAESQRQSSNIGSIDVVCREGKPYGRGLKSIRHPEIKDVATRLGLSVHQIKTFTGWNPPQYPSTKVPQINLIIAVSFGLFVPPRILNGARYSGINLHPSLLPEYKGPAPLHWTILNGEQRTGMTLQTLHPASFDAGTILDQTPSPGITIPEDCDYNELLDIMRPLGADMLVRAIRNRLYLPPHDDAGWLPGDGDSAERPKHAPKIETAHRLLRFEVFKAPYLLSMSRAFESTWAYAAAHTASTEFKRLRVIFKSPFYLLSSSSRDLGRNGSNPEVAPGLPYWSLEANSNESSATWPPLLINTLDGKTLSAVSMKVEGGVEMLASHAAMKHKLVSEPRMVGSRRVVTFHETLST